MDAEVHGGSKQNEWLKARQYSDEERRLGIARLLAEAYCSRLRKQGKLREFQRLEQNPLPLDTRPDFLR